MCILYNVHNLCIPCKSLIITYNYCTFQQVSIWETTDWHSHSLKIHEESCTHSVFVWVCLSLCLSSCIVCCKSIDMGRRALSIVKYHILPQSILPLQSQQCSKPLLVDYYMCLYYDYTIHYYSICWELSQSMNYPNSMIKDRSIRDVAVALWLRSEHGFKLTNPRKDCKVTPY